MKLQILRMLIDNQGEWISGENLSQKAGVTRSCIWKYVRSLKQEGYVIESTPSKGYRLMDTQDTLSREELLIELSKSKMISDVVHLKTTSTTNGYARDLDRSDLLVIAEEQTGGKGRMGRTWISPSGQGVWMTVSLKPSIAPSGAALITQIAAASVWEAIRDLTGLQAGIKWPNDILLGQKKICGILTEMQAELGAIDKLLVGIGVNVNIEAFPTELELIATSLYKETGKRWSRKELLLLILKYFEKHYKVFESTGDVKKVMDLCREHSTLLGKPIKIINGNKEEYGLAIALGDRGELMVKKENGEIVPIISGEVSVRENLFC